MPDSKLQTLHRLFDEMGSVLVAYSGGIDSTVVLKVAHDRLGDRVVGVTAASPTMPASELEEARRVAAEIGAPHLVIETDQLALPAFVRNEADRCFHCKTDLYEAMGRLRAERNGGVIVDGTNLDDLGDDRPGILAARRLGVRSPLVEAELTKQDVRDLARSLGLSIWDKPAAACLSSRIPRGIAITRETLRRVEQAEACLQEEGFRLVRVRDQGETARIEVDRKEVPRLLEEPRRSRVAARLTALGFRHVTVDLEGYKRGGANS
jgi:uncharacterized protein